MSKTTIQKIKIKIENVKTTLNRKKGLKKACRVFKILESLQRSTEN